MTRDRGGITWGDSPVNSLPGGELRVRRWRCGTNYGHYTKSYRFGQLTSFTDKIRFTNHGRQFQTRAGLEYQINTGRTRDEQARRRRSRL